MNRPTNSLNFNKALAGAKFVSLGEVAPILRARSDQLDHEMIDLDRTEMEHTLNKVLDYCEQFGQVKKQDTIESLRHRLKQFGLVDFEVATLINLRPKTVNEAKVYLPSLEDRLSDYYLDEIIDTISLNSLLI